MPIKKSSTSKKSNINKVMDVAKPGTSKATPTSRPLIVGHGPMASDPLLKHDENPSQVEEKDNTELPMSPHKEVKPISDVSPPTEEKLETVPESAESDYVKTSGSEAKAVPEAASDEPAPDSVAAILKKEAEAVKPLAKTPKAKPANEAGEKTIDPPEESTEESNEEAPSDDTAKETDAPADVVKSDDTKTDDTKPETAEGAEPSDKATTEAVADQAAIRKVSSKEAKEAEAKKAAVEKLVQDKTYFVPTGHDSTQKHAGKGALVALLIILVLAAGAYLAFDAGWVKVDGFEVPYHLIGNK